MSAQYGTAHRTVHGKQRKRALYEGSNVVYESADRDPKADWTPISIEKYEEVKKIGEGTYGSVFKANAPSGKHVALKMVRTENEKEGFPITAIREIKILKALDHPNIVPLMDVVTSPRANHDNKDARVYMVFEYMDHDLAGLINNPEIQFTDANIKHYMKEILEGLHFCHQICHVLHRDIKGSNVLINNDGAVKLADFGLARLFKEREEERDYTNRVVTLWYRAPELLFGDTKYGPAIDMWSAGCVFAEMVTGQPIFPANTECNQITEICKTCGSPTEENWPGHSKLPVKVTKIYPRQMNQKFAKIKRDNPLAFDLLDRLLVLDPKKRFTATQALDHDYFHKSPHPQKPNLHGIQPSHEFESRERKKLAREQKQKQQAQSNAKRQRQLEENRVGRFHERGRDGRGGHGYGSGYGGRNGYSGGSGRRGDNRRNSWI